MDKRCFSEFIVFPPYVLKKHEFKEIVNRVKFFLIFIVGMATNPFLPTSSFRRRPESTPTGM